MDYHLIMLLSKKNSQLMYHQVREKRLLLIEPISFTSRFSSRSAHKSQGQTLSKAIVDLVPVHGKTGGIGIEFAYVPLSRVRRLEDLTILRPFDPSVLKTPVNEGCAAMMDEFKKRDLAKDL